MYIAQEHVLPDSWHVYSLFVRSDYSNRLRTITKQFLLGAGLSKLAPMQKAAGTRFVYNLSQSGDMWQMHLAMWGLFTPVAMLSGAPLEEFDPGWVQDYNISQELMTELFDPDKAPPVDIFPILRWMPAIFAEWKRKAPKARKALLHAYDVLITQAKKDRTCSFQPLIPKLITQSLDPSTPADGRFTDQEIKVMMGGMLDAGVGSTIMTFQSVLLALTAHPEVQKKAQAEIDAAFGSETTLPDKIDLDKLPYLNACVCETLRWRPLGAYPIGAFGLPRETVNDEQLNGYRIPKGTTILLNQWTIAHDADFYEDPETYNPQRFVDDPVGAKKGVSQAGRKPIYTFGAGRRECPGKEFFFQNVRIAFAQILWAFDLVPDGELDTDPTTGFTPSIVMMPKPFKVKFVPRRDGMEDVLLREKEKADAKLSEIFA
ncbi:MAG: hypothetical protein Q9165_003485 [Trypethelium subeluteriae]